MSEDLVRAKLVTSMRQPGGNITGVRIMGTELDAKRLEILAELLELTGRVLHARSQSHTVPPGMGTSSSSTFSRAKKPLSRAIKR